MAKARTNKRHAAAADPGPRKYLLIKGKYSYDWQNRDGRLVRLDVINEWGIRRIYDLLCERIEDDNCPRGYQVPYCWIQAVREHAAARGINLQELPEQKERTG